MKLRTEGVGASNGTKAAQKQASVARGVQHRVQMCGAQIQCTKIHKSDLAREVKLKRSSRAEREWTMKDWHAAMDGIRKRG